MGPYTTWVVDYFAFAKLSLQCIDDKLLSTERVSRTNICNSSMIRNYHSLKWLWNKIVYFFLRKSMKNLEDHRLPFLNIFFRLRLHGIGYAQIRLGSDPLCLHGIGSKLERYGSIWDHLYKWTHLVPDSRSDPYRIQQVPCKHKSYPYQFRMDPVPCKRCLSFRVAKPWRC